MTTKSLRTALVTGAGQGIGRAIATRLARDGFHVVVVDQNAEAAQQTAQSIGGRAEVCDVTDQDAVHALARDVEHLSALINNAGIFPPTTIAEADPELFRRVMDVNVLGALLFSQAFLPQLTASHGSIVNIASIAAKAPTPGTGAYSPSKAALVSLTKLCAVEFAARGIRVNAVAPGGVATEGTASYTADPAREARFNALIPLGRRGLPEDIADAVPFFLTEDSRYVTGQVLYVDGGLTESTIGLLRAAQSSPDSAP